MPIPRELFDGGIDEFDRVLLDFLHGLPDQAFSVLEIGDAMSLSNADLASRASLIERLNDLERQGEVVGRVIHGVAYFSTP